MNLPIYKQILNLITDHESGWLVTVINTDGSTPGKVGMKMLVKSNDVTIGTIGGGTIEKMVIDNILDKKYSEGTILSFDLGKNGVFVPTGMICGGQQEIFVEPLANHQELYIIGGGHCGQALGEIMSKVNFMVTVIDNRSEWVDAEKHPHANRLICADYHDITQHITFNANAFIVVMTHSHGLDEMVVKELINKEYKYLGVIGSKTKAKTLLSTFQQNGLSQEKLQKIFMPIGFAIGTQTPFEIAISIAAQILAIKNGATNIIFNSNPLLGD